MREIFDTIEEKRHTRFVEMVTFARANSPYYRELYWDLPKQIENPTLLPVTNKKELMTRFDDWAIDRDVTYKQVQEFIADQSLIGKDFLGKYRVAMTSGSTGTRGIFVIDKSADAITEALSKQMMMSWLGVDGMRILGDGRTAVIIATGGHTAANSRQISQKNEARPYTEKKRVFSVHMSIPELVSHLNEYQPSLMQGYASTVALLAEEQEAGHLHISPVLVLPTSEGLTERGYEKIARAFNTKVGTFYGGTECGAIAWGCEHQWLHLNSDWAIVEPVDTNFQPVAAGVQSHTVLVSNLANRVQPILRYDMGDSIIVRPDLCPCGNPLPAIRVQGRIADILTFPSQNGGQTKITSLQFEMLFDRTPGVQLFQVVQTSPTVLRVRLRTAEGSDQDQVWKSVHSEAIHLLAEYKLDYVRVERAIELPERAKGGKYREVIPLDGQ